MFNDPRNRTNDMRAYLDLKYEHTFANQLGFMARLYYDRYYYTGDYLYPNFVLNKDLGRGEWWGCEVQVSKKLFDRHHLIVGMEYRDNIRQDQGNFDEAPFFRYLDDKRHSTIWAFYAQDEFKILKNLILNAGVRYDHYSTFGGTTNPRLALIYSPFTKTTLKLIYGTAFRAPNVYELFYQDGGVTVKPNPSLKPEKIKTYELVWEQYLGRQYRLVASGFYYKIRDLIGQQADPDGLLVYRNSEGVSAKGVELELRGKWAGGLEGRISYTLQEAKDAQTGKLLSNSPKHLPKFNLIVPLFKDKLFSGIEVQYLSKRKTINNSHVGDAVITNLTLFNRNLFKNLELSASVYNLFNQKFRDPGGEEHLMNGMSRIIQDGITFRLKLSYSF